MQEIQRLIKDLEKEMKEFRLKVNLEKTEVVAVNCKDF